MSNHQLYVSHANQWIPCPGSYQVQQRHPKPLYQATINGIQEHEEAAQAVLMNIPITTPEVQQYVDLITDGTPRRRVLEQRLPLSQDGITLGVKSDCINIFADRVDVWDYKSGYTPVSAKSNWQLLAGAMAAVDNLPEATKDMRFNLYIHQPRVFDKPQLWTVDYAGLMDYRALMFRAARKALSPNPDINAGHWCYNCGGLAHCNTAEQAEKRLLEVAGYLMDAERSPDMLGGDLVILKAASGYLSRVITALEARVANELKLGNPVPGWELSTTRSRVVWDDSKNLDLLEALSKQMDICMWKKDPITPLQLIKAGVPETVVKQFTVSKPGNLTLKQREEIQWSTIS